MISNGATVQAAKTPMNIPARNLAFRLCTCFTISPPTVRKRLYKQIAKGRWRRGATRAQSMRRTQSFRTLSIAYKRKRTRPRSIHRVRQLLPTERCQILLESRSYGAAQQHQLSAKSTDPRRIVKKHAKKGHLSSLDRLAYS